ncbi:patatin-like phospholipase family protein [Aureimonas mangrovi]|uniref:patatin-like phospholipase family protein n=1 Tax=Aureimonas mangrovi TaxID=2758041 RepID=UPI00163DDED6|nr:patatin-like phospholipase family protein [Aureimonas mangrovi]
MSIAERFATSLDSGSEPRIGLALGGGGARGITHIHVLAAFDDLGIRPAAIAGSSIGAMLGAAYAAGMSAREIEDYALDHLGNSRSVLSHLWRTRAASFAEFIAEGGFRIGQMNAERVIGEFMPIGMPHTFEELDIPLTVTATCFYEACGCNIDEGDLVSALAASIALPAVFRPVVRDGSILIDGGICNPLPYDLLADYCTTTVAVDVTGPPDGSEGRRSVVPTQIDTMMGASQLMMHAVIEMKRRYDPPGLLIRPPVSRYRVLDFMRVASILKDTAFVREEAKRDIAALVETAARAG